jgi:hypothetical protein
MYDAGGFYIKNRTMKTEKEKNLRLPVTTKWFEMTKAGIKTEDYREITPYWVKRLTQFDKKECDIDQACDFLKKGKEYNDTNCFGRVKYSFYFPKKFRNNIMTLAYPKSTDSERISKLEHKGIEIRTGNSEWGAEPNKLYFVIMHGNILT